MAQPQFKTERQEPAGAPRKRRDREYLTPFWVVMSATMLKNSLILKRYLPNLVGYLAEIGLRVVFFLLFSRSLTLQGPAELQGKQLFIFFLAGILLLLFSNTALKTPIGVVSEDLMNGTLEYLYSNPISRYPYYVGAVAVAAMLDSIFFVPMLIFTVWYAGISLGAAGMVLLVCLLVLVTLMAMGALVSLLGLLWRQVSSLLGLLGLVFEFLAGAYLPVAQFPTLVKYFAYLLPYTWGYDLVRYFTMGDGWQTIAPPWIEGLILVGDAILFTVLALLLMKKVEQQAKRRGLHLI